MNPWLRSLVIDHLITQGGMHAARAADVVDSLGRKLEDRHMAVVPTFLSDEMFEALVRTNPVATYLEKNREYMVAVEACQKITSTY